MKHNQTVTGEGNAPRVSKSSELCKEAMLLGKNQAWAFSKLAEAHDKVTAQRDELLAACEAVITQRDELLEMNGELGIQRDEMFSLLKRLSENKDIRFPRDPETNMPFSEVIRAAIAKMEWKI